MKKIGLSALMVILTMPVFSQKKMRVNKAFGRTHTETGITFSSGGDATMVSPSLVQYWSFGEVNRKFKFGLGARLNSVWGTKNLEYITARAKLTSDKVGPAVFFADQVVENIDTFGMEKTRLNSLNTYLALRYDFHPAIGLEFNIDLVGLTFGPRQAGTLTYDDGKTQSTNADPTFGNVLLISDNDIGNLNSELMFSYTHKKKMKFKIGAVFLFNEYTISNPAVYVNNKGTVIDAERFRNKSFQLGIGFNYAFNYFITKNFKN